MTGLEQAKGQAEWELVHSFYTTTVARKVVYLHALSQQIPFAGQSPGQARC